MRVSLARALVTDPGHSADGRAVRGARRDHPLQAQQRSAGAVAQAAQDRHLRHPFGVRVGVSVAAGDRDDARGRAASAAEFRIDAPEPRGEEFRTSAEYAGYCREVSERAGAVLFRAVGRWRLQHRVGHGTVRPPAAACASVLPAVVLAAGIAVWELVVRAQRYPALCAAGARRSCSRRWSATGRCCRNRCCVTLLTTLEGFLRRGRRRHRAGAAVQPVEMAGIFAVSLCGDPAGHAGDRDRAAAPDLSAAADRGGRLRLDRRVLSGAVQHHARAELGRSQSGRAVSALRRVADADAAVPEIAGGACRIFSADCGSRAACR